MVNLSLEIWTRRVDSMYHVIIFFGARDTNFCKSSTAAKDMAFNSKRRFFSRGKSLEESIRGDMIDTNVSSEITATTRSLWWPFWALFENPLYTQFFLYKMILDPRLDECTIYQTNKFFD